MASISADLGVDDDQPERLDLAGDVRGGRRGAGYDVRLSGTIQEDIFKEFIAQKESVHPDPRELRIVRDLIMYSRQYGAVQPDQHLWISHSEAGSARHPRRSLSPWRMPSPTSKRS